MFYSVAVETLGVFGPSSMKFLEDVGSNITKKATDKGETECLFQRICFRCYAGRRLLGYGG